MTAHESKIETRFLAAVAVLACLIAVPAQALTFADPIPDKEHSLGFDVAAPGSPDYIMSQDMTDFLDASVDPADNAPVTFSMNECFMYAGTTGCQASVPKDVGPYTGVTTYTVTAIDVAVPPDGLFLFIGGMGNSETEVPLGNPSAPDYALGSVQLLTDGGSFGGTTLPALQDALLSFGPGQEYVYFGKLIFAVGDSLTFGYQVDLQLEGGTPIFFSNAARNFVPEPSTALLVGFGLAVMARRRASPPGVTGRSRG